ncbi:DUF4398 domain-containing protein [Dokdonella sp.]|uniref:DUF4398 domain-containing protein n=1 Tax=Dokdonella sp. TaxID=2291710 RepID=UPI0025BF74D2|nr:DUF4398 domain-containing protein [Dokdonella sp.]MBX3692209.1 DUF4398 domain-containing protein [Dokdonella sp.]MCW5567299.1 DUF4398 domain-containing protein [Dokdonella sp.]
MILLFAVSTAWAAKRPPPDLLGPAQSQLRAARTEGASTYAPLELRFAEERLDQAQVAVDERDYALASRLAAESAVNSELATLKARLGKRREAVEELKRRNEEVARTLHMTGEGEQ